MHQLVLASQSPRRSELLTQAGYKFTVDSLKVSELFDKNLNLEAALMAVAGRKASVLAGSGKYLKGQGFLILGADTIVVLDGQVLGKPNNARHAEEILGLLSGKTHSVMTGITVFDVDLGRSVSAFDQTKVRFHDLTDQQIKAYVATGEPLDKAGAYGIQGGAQIFVAERIGSWSNVVGLPLELWETMVQKNGWNIARTTSS